MSDYEKLAREALERAERLQAAIRGVQQPGRKGEEIGEFIKTKLDFQRHSQEDVRDLANAVLDQQAEIERLQAIIGSYVQTTERGSA